MVVLLDFNKYGGLFVKQHFFLMAQAQLKFEMHEL